MKAAVVESPGQLVVKDVPEPPRDNPYEARCEVLFGATCTGTDLHIISNTLPWKVPYPCILGHESMARVIEPGPKTRHYRKGDIVYLATAGAEKVPGYNSQWGGFAEFVWIADCEAMRADGLDVKDDNARVLPAGIDPAAATMLLTWCEGYAYVTAMGIGAGATCLLLGSGGNGLTFAAMARIRGASKIVMAGSAARETAARAVGVTEFFDYRSGTLIEDLKRACPEGYDFVVDVVGAGDGLSQCLALIRRGATIGVYGLDDGFDSVLKPWHSPSFTWFDGTKHPAAAFDDVLALMRSGQLDAGVWMDYRHARSLDEIALVYEDLRLRKTAYPKAVIRVRG